MARRGITLTQIRLEQDQAEKQILADGSLRGERAVSIARVVYVALVAAATSIGSAVSTEPVPDTPVRHAVVGTYLMLALGTLVTTHRLARGSVRRALFFPFIATAVDYGFLLANAWIDAELLGLEPLPHVAVATAAVFLCFSIARYSQWYVAASVVGAIVTVTLIGVKQGWMNATWGGFVAACYLTLGVLIAFTNHRLRKMFVDVRRHENLQRYLPQQVVERLLRRGGAALEPVEREVTVLFSDIRDFTALSERQPPEEVMRFLDEYFGHMVQIVKGHEGMMNKFIGDGLMAVWGVPEPQEDHAERALRAAIDMRRKLDELNGARVREGKKPIRIGIGVHTGVVAAGMLGGAEQREYTVIGDAVNLASRIEGLTKQFGADILASESAWRRSGQKLRGERVGEVRVKGREEAVVVYAVEPVAAAAQAVTS